MSLRPTSAVVRTVTEAGASHDSKSRLKFVLGCGLYDTQMKRGLDSVDGPGDSVVPKTSKVEIRWELVGIHDKAKTIPPNDIFVVPAAILRLNNRENTLVHMDKEYIMLHAHLVKSSDKGHILSGVYIFFSNDFLHKLRGVIDGLPDPDPRLKDPSIKGEYPNGYKIQ